VPNAITNNPTTLKIDAPGRPCPKPRPLPRARYLESGHTWGSVHKPHPIVHYYWTGLCCYNYKSPTAGRLKVLCIARGLFCLCRTYCIGWNIDCVLVIWKV